MKIICLKAQGSKFPPLDEYKHNTLAVKMAQTVNKTLFGASNIANLLKILYFCWCFDSDFNNILENYIFNLLN